MTADQSAHDPLGLIGVTVAEKYRVESLAGEGGFSVVYRAQHLIWQQPVAVKFFNILGSTKPDQREQLLADFILEGRLMTELSSRCAAIVQARDIGKLATSGDDWIPYMVLEWLDGTPLDIILYYERQRQEPARDLAAAIDLLEPAAVALDVAHAAGIAHRDLKPANIMVMGDARATGAAVKLLDFGIAKVMAEQTELADQMRKTGQQITAFTPSHGAPEQFSRSFGATGPWTDVYAMALIVTGLLLGRDAALEGESFFELGKESCDPDRRPTPRTLGAQVSDAVEAVFVRALAVRPEDRYPEMGSFWKALHEAAHPAAEPWRGLATGPVPAISAPGQPAPSGPGAAPTSGAGMVTPDGPTALPAFDQRITASISQRYPMTLTGATVEPQGPRWALVGALMVACLAAGGLGVALLGRSGETSAPAASATATSAPAPAPPPAPKGPCPEGMKPVPGRTYSMGSDEEGFKLWKPAHEVTVDTFCLDVTEVTVKAYMACVKRGKCGPPATVPDFPKSKGVSDEDHKARLKIYAELCNGGRNDRDDHPINCVAWKHADAYCKEAGGRLPTEAEWELAARGGDGRRFPWGDDAGDHTYMNAGGPEWGDWLESHGLPRAKNTMYPKPDGFAGTAPVGRFPRAQTQSGQLDMIGNVWEWTSDWFAVYKPEAQVNPKGPAAGDRKIIRGGGYNGEYPIWVNPAARYHQLATATAPVIGFRCAAKVRDAE